MNALLPSLLIVLLLSSCAEWRAVSEERATAAADAQAKVSKFAYCRANSTGWLLMHEKAVQDEYIKHCGKD